MSYPAFQAPWIEEEGVKKHKHDFFVLSMYNKTIIRFGFCDIQNNQGLGKGYQPRPWGRTFWGSLVPK